MLPDMPLLAWVAVTFVLLALAIAAAWCPWQFRWGPHCLRPWALLHMAAVLCALLAGFVQMAGVAALVALAWLARSDAGGGGPPPLRCARGALLVVLGAGLAAHVIPGFDNPVLLRDHLFTPDAAPYTQHANFDKGSMGLLLLVYCCARINGADAWRAMLARVLPVLAGTCAAVVVTALLLGYVRFDVKLPAYTPVFLAVNLFFTCVAEEALFRGVLQQRLTTWLRARSTPRAGLVALLAVALLFGTAHAGGGWGHVALATLAGAGYGLAFLRTARIEASILVHFAVNATHFIGFTYPRLA